MTFLPIISRRRDGGRHTEGELRDLARGAAEGSVPDYQLAAWLMAAYLNPLDEDETAALTLAMADSGDRLDLSSLPRPWVDKHSTGGVGDKTTLVLLPLLAACGLTMVKMSGRGLGITGRDARQALLRARLAARPFAGGADRGRAARSASPSAARPPASRPPTACSTPCATRPGRSPTCR